MNIRRDPTSPTINILGTRGIPVGHSGYETFVLHLAPFLRDRGWNVNVYCQLEPNAEGVLVPDYEDEWNGIRRIHLGSTRTSSAGSIIFDFKSVLHVLKQPGIDLVLGYNTAIFNLLQRIRGRKILMNMDGIEWKRSKWSRLVQAWFYLNEFIGVHVAQVPIADHPEIATHLRRHGRKFSKMIAYGADHVTDASKEALEELGVAENNFFVSIARIEPENSILEIVRAFSSRRRGAKLLVLGRMIEGRNFTEMLRSVASDEVIFPGPIFDQKIVRALRRYCIAYVHGHQVGGTNPSLVEALGAGSAVIAHDNKFNRWVAGSGQTYFADERQLGEHFDAAISGEWNLEQARAAASERYFENFTWQKILGEYESVLRTVWNESLPREVWEAART